jgi:MerR family transcriptional regulator, light-induced transcriptional regulator
MSNRSINSGARYPTDVPILEALVKYGIPALYKERFDNYASRFSFTHDQILHLTHASYDPDPKAIIGITQAYLSQGFPIDMIYVQGITQAAALLGEMWERDEITFFEVTLGAQRLQDLLFNGYSYFDDQTPSNAVNHEYVVLFARPPDSHHSLGVLVVREVFRRHGWNILTDIQSDAKSIANTISTTHVDVIGISVAIDDHLNTVKDFITLSRAKSMNKKLCVMVGGPQAFLKPNLSDLLGADFSSKDASDAVHDAYEVVKHHQTRSST